AAQSNVLAQDQAAGDDSSQTQLTSSQNNTANQNANDNHSTATSGPVSISGGGDVTADGFIGESLAEAGSHIGQLAGQSNDLEQSQDAGDHSTQIQSQDGQSNTANQNANGNTASATSGPVAITGLGSGDVNVTGSDLESD